MRNFRKFLCKSLWKLLKFYNFFLFSFIFPICFILQKKFRGRWGGRGGSQAPRPLPWVRAWFWLFCPVLGRKNRLRYSIVIALSQNSKIGRYLRGTKINYQWKKMDKSFPLLSESLTNYKGIMFNWNSSLEIVKTNVNYFQNNLIWTQI